MKEMGVGYGSINHSVDRDPVCGYTGILVIYVYSVVVVVVRVLTH